MNGETKLQETYKLYKWDVLENQYDHLPDRTNVTKLLNRSQHDMLYHLHKDDPKHIEKWLGLKKGLGKQSLVGPGIDCYLAPLGAPALLKDMTLLRTKYGPDDLRPIEAITAVRLFVAELCYIFDTGRLKSLDIYAKQHFFRFENKLLVSESTFREAGTDLPNPFFSPKPA